MKEQLKMVLFVVLLGIAAAAILVGSETFTTPVIAKQQELTFQMTVLDAFGIEYTRREVPTIYETKVSVEEVEGYTFYTSEDGLIGYEFVGPGLWGPIEGFIVLEADLMTISAIRVRYNIETPGLGGIIGEQWYLDKYIGKAFTPEIVVKRDADMSISNEIDAITGATGTSSAFMKIMNNHYADRKAVLE